MIAFRRVAPLVLGAFLVACEGEGVRARVVQMGAHDVPGIRLEFPPFQVPCIAC